MPQGRALALFNFDWDHDAFERLSASWAIDSAGFDLFTFPSYVRLAWFDLHRFVERLARQARSRGWRSVVSHHEQFGALAAALLAERMGWPGTPVRAVLACQHKLHARKLVQQVCPEANIAFEPLQARYGDPIPGGLRYPLFVKPVKAAFSVLARTVRHHDELTALTRFGPAELWIIRRLVEPFERIARERLPGIPTAHGMQLEQPVQGTQHNLDGWVHRGHVHALGVVDALMYPGTQAFQRFQYPSRLASAVQQRALEVAARFLEAVGFDHGFFNMEFFVDAASGQVKVIEFNPRLASQLADLYRRVDGLDAHAGSLALANGDDPRPAMRACTSASAGAAASFVFRAFDVASVPAMPDAARLQALREAYGDSWISVMPKSGRGLARDFKWLGSHRYGVLHLGGADEHQLHERYRHACRLLQWPAHEGPVAAPQPIRSIDSPVPEVLT